MVKEIDFVDSTFRDAHQSLWGDKMNTAMMYMIAPMMNRAGFKAIDVSGPGHFGFAVRYFREDPWERVRILSKAIPSTPLSIMMLGTSLNIFGFIKGPIMEVWMKRLFANGIRRVQIMEASNNMDDISGTVRSAKSAGLKAAVALVYSHSPIHTDEYYAKRARDAVKIGSDIIFLKDSGGLITPERTRTLIPKIQQNINELPFEFHSHCTTGLAPLCYLEAMRLGVKTFHTAISPLANGSSLPSTENILRNERHLGYSSNVDEQALGMIATHFRMVAEREELPTGSPVEYDLAQYEHQVPGGVISNLRRQLSEIGSEHRLKEILEESILVRKELGFPIMVTPFSQFVVTQASLNVTQGERYHTITDEVIKFALGYYGKQAMPLDQNIMDRIISFPRAKEFIHWEPPETSIEELRREIGKNLSDDELLLIVLSSEEDFKAMRAAGPTKTDYPSPRKPLVAFIEELTKRKNSTYINIKQKEFSMTLRRNAN